LTFYVDCPYLKIENKNYLKFDTQKDRVFPPLLTMFDKISHFNRFVGNGRHGVSFFGYRLTSHSEAEEFIIRNQKKKEERNEEEGK
jgi:hypothetical protein